MNPIRWHVFVWCLASLALPRIALPQSVQTDPHIGYVYPAGGRIGTTVHATVGGQHLDGVTDVLVTGQGIQARVVKHTVPLTQRRANELREILRQAREKAKANNSDGKAAGNDDETVKRFAKELGLTDEDLNAFEEFEKQRRDPKRQPNPQIAEKVFLQIDLDPEAELGTCELRLKTPAGVSNPLAFRVQNLPECYETEPNDETTDTEISEPLPVILNGQILPGDVDRFRFRARKGERLVVVVRARELIPYLADAVPGWFQATLTLWDEQGTELAFVDDYRFHPDPVLYYRIPKSGQYVLQINDAIYRGREDFVYRITVGETPFVTSIFPMGGRRGHPTTIDVTGWNLRIKTLTLDADTRPPGIYPIDPRGDRRVSNHALFAVDTLPECLEEEPNNDRPGAQHLRPPLIVNGHIDLPGDWDVFRFAGRAGGRVVVEVQARRLNSALDSLLRLTDASGRQLMVNDDHEDKGAGLATHHADSFLLVTLPEDGEYYVYLGDTQGKGGADYGYRLRISARHPDFELRVAPSAMNARAGTSVPITVYALRRDGFSGDISLRLRDAPPGFALSGGWVPAHQDKVRLTLAVPATPLDEPINLHLEGLATIRGNEVHRPAVPAEDMMQAFIYRHLVPAQNWMVSVSGPPLKGTPKSLAAKTESSGHLRSIGDAPVKIPVGGFAQVQLASPGGWIIRDVEPNEPPDGIIVQRISSDRKSVLLVVTADAEKVQPGLKGNLIVAATNGRKQLGTLPAIPFEVVESAEPAP